MARPGPVGDWPLIGRFARGLGTTWCGAGMGRFRPAMFQAAIDAGAVVRPIAIRYRTEDGRSTSAAAFVGPDSLIRSLRSIRSRP